VSEGWAAVKLGRWASAGAAADEGVRLAAESAQPRWGASCSLIAAVIAGYQGDEATAVGLVDTADRVLLPANATAMLCLVQMARGSIALGSSRFGEAFDHLARVFDPSDVAFHDVLRGWMVFDLAEAAGLSGEEDEPRRLLAAVAPLATATGSPVITANVLCATALLAPRDHAEEPYLQALAGDLDDWPFLRARVLLAFGTWLRRRRRVVESRAHLRASRDAFDSLSATPWSNRANQELRAAGETVAGRQPSAGALTPQEFQIATLATQGLSNRDIGQRLFLSHRTVGAHLYRIFPKLGVTSRTELASVLRPDGARA
jgi:DNA-binding CsgD family transcriptional regulator